MTRPSENLFAYYRGPSARQSDGAGVQLEDNTTANLLYILDQLAQTEPRIARDVIGRLAGDRASDLPEIEGLDCTAQQSIEDISPAERTVLTVVASNTPRPEHTQVGDDPGGRCDGAIRVDDELAIVLEVKFGDAELGDEQWSRYSEALDPDAQPSLSWRDVYDSLSDIKQQKSDLSPVTELLLEEFTTFLREHTLSKSIAVSEWDTGQNSIDLRHHERMNRATSVAGSIEPPIQIRFHSTGRKSISFSQEEWEALLEDLDDDLLDALAAGDWKPFEDTWKQEGKGTIELARVGDSSGPWKTLRLDTRNDRPHLTLQSRTPESNSWYINRPVIAPSEFEEFYAEDHHLPSFRDDQVTALFKERDLESAI